MLLELTGEGAMPPQLLTPARRLLEIAELRVRLRRSIRRGSLLRRQYINPATRFSYLHSPLKSDLQLSDSKLNFFVNVGNEVADASDEVIHNLSRVLFKSSQLSLRSRSVKYSSKVLVNPLFAGVNQHSRSRSVKRTSIELVNPLSAAIIVPGADPWRARAQSSLVLDRWHRNSSQSRSVEISSRVLVNPMCSIFNRDFWSVDRCSFASDAHDHEASFCTASRTHSAEYGFHGSSGGPVLDPITHIVHRNSHLSKKEKLKATNSIADSEDVNMLQDANVLIIREKLAELYESEQQWSKAAQMLSGIDLESGMRVVDDNFRLSKCVLIARLYLEDDNVEAKFEVVFHLQATSALFASWDLIDRENCSSLSAAICALEVSNDILNMLVWKVGVSLKAYQLVGVNLLSLLYSKKIGAMLTVATMSMDEKCW